MTLDLHRAIKAIVAREQSRRGGMSMTEIADTLGTVQSVVSRWNARKLRDEGGYKKGPNTTPKDMALMEAVREHFPYADAPEAAPEDLPLPDNEDLPEDIAERVFTHRSDGEVDVKVITSRQTRTLDQLLDVCGFDGDDWYVKDWQAGAHHTPMRLRRRIIEKNDDGTEKLIRLNDEPEVVPAFRVSARFAPNRPAIAIRKVADEAIEAMREAAPVITFRGPVEDGDHLLVLAIPDLHLGKAAAGWTPGRAADVYEEAAADLVSKSRPFGVAHVLMVVGNDGIQVDGSGNMTYRGTRVEVNSMWHNQFRAYHTLIRRVARMIAERYAVSILFVPGNHDRDSTFTAGEVVSVAFEGTDRVSVLNEHEPSGRHYFRYGKNLLGFTHGDTGKFSDLDRYMTRERPVDFAECVCHEWHTGHLHKRLVDTTFGVVSRISPALCPADDWHRKMGFVGSLRGAEAVVYHEEHGRVGEFAYAVPQELEAAA